MGPQGYNKLRVSAITNGAADLGYPFDYSAPFVVRNQFLSLIKHALFPHCRSF